MLNNKTIIVVLGMHRSGTSAITRGINALGVEVGDNLLPPAGDNEKGFWEDKDIVSLNCDLLHHLGHDHQTLEPLYPSALIHSNLQNFKIRAIALLKKKTQRPDYLVIKDPRIARLLPFWRAVFEHLKLNIKYVITLRHPMSVVRSLAKRDKFSHEKGYILWFEYLLFSLTETFGQPRVVVDYDRLMFNPDVELNRIAQTIGLTYDATHPEVIEYKNVFLDKRLTHTVYQTKEILTEPFVTTEIRTLFELANQCAADQIDMDDPDLSCSLHHLMCSLENNRLFFRHLKMIETELTNRNAQLAKIKRRFRRLYNLNFSLFKFFIM